MGALVQLHRQGKALYVGISSYDAGLTRRAAAILAEEKVPLFIPPAKLFDPEPLDRT